MALNITKIPFSGSTHGRGVKVVATATPGTTIHTAQSGSSDDNWDEIWASFFNSDTVSRLLTVEFGGTTAPDDNIVTSIPPQQGLILVVPGLVLRNSLIMKAFASVANVIIAYGYVNRNS